MVYGGFFVTDLTSNYMNITELARRLKLSTQELRALLPQLGFDIGSRAIKVDHRVAEEIMSKLGNKKQREYHLTLLKKSQESEQDSSVEEKEEIPEGANRTLNLPSKVVVKDLAKMVDKDVTKLVVELMRQGIMASLNDSIDFETASIVAEDFGYTVVRATDVTEDEDDSDVRSLLEKAHTDDTGLRPPVVVVMGHVDHGKTTLLDTIREADVVSSESGGITQHIGAYQVDVPESGNTGGKKAKTNMRTLTFIDTPGHEAFSLMRSRGARIADLAILVVAADDGVQPQTIEAISHIKKAELPFVVAINKIDKPEANPDKIKTELSEVGVTPEEWGGDIMMIHVSAKEGIHIPELLESLLLLADMGQDHIVADAHGEVIGTVIESHVDKGSGPQATILVRNGTLIKGSDVVVGNVPGRIRSMSDWQGNQLSEAGPSTPVVVLGLKQAPQVGDTLQAASDKRSAKKAAKQSKKKASAHALRSASQKEDDTEATVAIILKADVLGSLEAIEESLMKLNSKDLTISIIGHGVGYITEKDIMLAAGSDALVCGFHAKPTPEAEELARTQNVNVKTFKVIYDLIDHVAAEASKRLTPDIIRTEIGRFKVIKVFRQDKTGIIVGGKVVSGSINSAAKLTQYRGSTQLGEGTINELQSGKEAVTEVVEDQEAGINVKGFVAVEPGDEFVVFTEEVKEKVVSAS